ncbi:unnamed protein product [Zymoseptoria tritici ST99CH_1E4]|uniref:Uncharacterized protein n=1 Tax=Zymoseptoria tritici ST99CH_1E4 TaxID=1276532 RepID=A0A2H1GQ30_ZYMTR|nr:unnamed protein product [Zymoseptoria tritici ST99CH_1E4]
MRLALRPKIPADFANPRVPTSKAEDRGLRKTLDEVNMSTVWKGLLPELVSMIIVINALTPLRLHGKTYRGRQNEDYDHMRALEPEKWQQVRNALAVSLSTRRDAIRALNRYGSIENERWKYFPPPYSSSPPSNSEPSWWLLRHFRWLHVNLHNTGMLSERASVRLMVRFPHPGVLRRVEHVLMPTPAPEKPYGDAELEAFMAGLCRTAGRWSNQFRTVGGWDMACATGNASDIRKLLVWKDGPLWEWRIRKRAARNARFEKRNARMNQRNARIAKRKAEVGDTTREANAQKKRKGGGT